MKQIALYDLLLAADGRADLVKENEVLTDGSISNPLEAVKVFNDCFHLNLRTEECVCMLCLDAKNHLIGAFQVFKGTVFGSLCSPREILVRALLCNASKILVAHNHPSGDTTPSKDDIKAMKDLKQACKVVGIPLVDSIIITKGFFLSLQECGVI